MKQMIDVFNLRASCEDEPSMELFTEMEGKWQPMLSGDMKISKGSLLLRLIEKW